MDRLRGAGHAPDLAQGHPHRAVGPGRGGRVLRLQVRLDAATFGRAVRAHWGIENRDHHVRDRTLREDASRIRRKPGVFARLRSFALNVPRAGGVGNVSEAVYVNALSLDRLLALGLPSSQN